MKITETKLINDLTKRIQASQPYLREEGDALSFAKVIHKIILTTLQNGVSLDQCTAKELSKPRWEKFPSSPEVRRHEETMMQDGLSSFHSFGLHDIGTYYRNVASQTKIGALMDKMASQNPYLIKYGEKTDGLGLA